MHPVVRLASGSPGINQKEADNKLKGAAKDLEKLQFTKDKLASNTQAPEEAKAQAVTDLEASQAKYNALKVQQDTDQECMQSLKQQLEDSLTGMNGCIAFDFREEAAHWTAAIPAPPGPASSWKNGPRVWPGFPLFSLVIFVRNAQQHLPQLIKEGMFVDSTQMQDFLLVKAFPWLSTVLTAFMEGPLKQAVEQQSVDGQTQAALQHTLDFFSM